MTRIGLSSILVPGPVRPLAVDAAAGLDPHANGSAEPSDWRHGSGGTVNPSRPHLARASGFAGAEGSMRG